MAGENLPRTRASARAKRSKFYFAGRRCPHGHVAPRLTQTKACTSCYEIRQRGYRRARAEARRRKVSAFLTALGGAARSRLAPYLAADGGPRSRAEARVLGEKLYVNGKSCPRGHVAPIRTTARGSCCECETLKHRAYKARNPELLRARRRAYTKANPEKIRALNKAQYDPARAREYREKHYERRKVLKAALQGKRDAQKLNAMPTWADEKTILEFYAEAARLTKETGIKHEVDHEVPLLNKLVCGLHVPANLRVITQAENRAKFNRFIVNK